MLKQLKWSEVHGHRQRRTERKQLTRLWGACRRVSKQRKYWEIKEELKIKKVEERLIVIMSQKQTIKKNKIKIK